jgi:glutamate-1-semialdehyde 2,1-aminomutase
MATFSDTSGHGEQNYIPAAKTTASKKLWERAAKVAPLGAQGEGKFYAPYPHFIRKAKGARVWDADGNEYLDYWNGAGPCVLGHADEVVCDAVVKSMAERGNLYCAPNEVEIQLCEKLASLIPCAEMSGLLNAGSDVLCIAVRVARSKTSRNLLVKFAGSYHGWNDHLLFNVSSHKELPDNRGLYKPIAESAGLPSDAHSSIRVLEYNDLEALKNLFRTEGDQIAAVFVEPVMHGPMAGCITPLPGFLEGIRSLCDQYGSLLVFDEILTGFRHDLGGSQKLCGVTPDLAAFGKGLSNGFPIAALCGSRSMMRQLGVDNKAFYSGTYNGNVNCVAAALATIDQLVAGDVISRIWKLGSRLRDGLNDVFRVRNATAQAHGYGSFVAIHASKADINSFGDVVRNHDTSYVTEFVSFLFENGVYLKPRKVARFAVSGAHSVEDIDRTIDVVDRYFTLHPQHRH